MRQTALAQTTSPHFTSFENAPLLLTLRELAQIYRCSPHTIRRKLEAGIFTPIPVHKRPYLWRKSDVEEDIKSLTYPREVSRNNSKPSRRRRRSRPQ